MKTVLVVLLISVLIIAQEEATIADAAKAVSFAMAQIGKGYSQNQCTGKPGECCRLGPKCYDCSGLVYMAWKAGGKTVPLTTQGYPSSKLKKITDLTPSGLKAGDILYKTGHVGLYVGGSTVVQAANSRVGVIKTSLSDYKKYYGATCAYRP